MTMRKPTTGRLSRLETNAKKPKPEVIGVADAGLGEVYARQGKVTEANAAFDAAAKADPTRAAFHLRNEAVIFFQEKNADAQVAAADAALAIDPNQPILYYIKGQGLIQRPRSIPRPTGSFFLPTAPRHTRSTWRWRPPVPMPPK